MIEKPRIRIRWLIRRDMAEVMEIENQSFGHAWSEEDFLICLRERGVIGMVAEHAETCEILGFMIYQLDKERLHILSLAVDPKWMRLEVGTQMIRRLIDKLSQQRRKELVTIVRETNLQAQLFFRSLGFKAVATLRRYYEQTTEDGYRMRYRLKPEDDIYSPYAPNNRISGDVVT